MNMVELGLKSRLKGPCSSIKKCKNIKAGTPLNRTLSTKRWIASVAH